MLAAVAFGFGDEAWTQTCTNTPAPQGWVYCSDASDSDINIDLDGVTVELPANAAGWSGVWGYHTGTGNINIKAEGGSVTTPVLLNAHGIFGWHAGTGDIDIKVLQGHAVMTEGNSAHGVYGLHFGAGNLGNIGINVQDSAITTSGDQAYGVYGLHNGTGDIGIEIQDSTVSLSGGGKAYGVFGRHLGTGDVNIEVRGSTITTSDDRVNGIVGWQESTNAPGDVSIEVQDSTISTLGAQAHGIWGDNRGTGDISIGVRDSTISISGDRAYGVHSQHRDTGDTSIKIQSSSITTSGDGADGIWGQHLTANDGDLDIEIQGGTISTSGEDAHGIYGHHQNTGGLGIEVQNSAINTSGANSYGIYAQRTNTGDVSIKVRDSTISTLGPSAYGIYGQNRSNGDLVIGVRSSTVTTSGGNVHGIYADKDHATNTGHLRINVKDSTVTTSGAMAHAVYGQHAGIGNLDIDVQGGFVHASGPDAHGIQAGRLYSGVSHFRRDVEGYSRQTVTVNGVVRGGSSDAAGVYLAGGGRVVIGPRGRVGAASGVAVRAAGIGPHGEPSLLNVDFQLDGSPIQEALGSGRIVNNNGPTELRINGVMLYDSAEGVAGRWVPNGAWDVMARAAAEGGIGMTDVYASRAELYESLPGLLLRLDAGAPVRRPEDPAWLRFDYGVGDGDPKRSQTGANYDFDRAEAAVGTSRNWENGFGGSLWLRHLQSEVKSDAVSGAGELELHGVGAGMAVHWRGAGGLEVSGEVSLTDFDVDADSKRHGRLARDVGAELWQARLAVEYRMGQANGLALFPRAWAWHAEADIDDFTDAVGSRVRYADESRSTVGLGVLAEVTQLEYSLYGSLDLESVFAGEETVVQVSGQQLASESKRTRVLAGMGGRWQGQRVTLHGGLRLADPGGKNQEISASVLISGSF